MKKECTFIPNTQLSKQKNQKVLSRGSPHTITQSKYEQANRTSFGSINLDGIAKKKQIKVDEVVEGKKILEAPRYDALYNKAKKQIEKKDKTKEDYEFERHG